MFAYFHSQKTQPPQKALGEGEEIEATEKNGLLILTGVSATNQYTKTPFEDDETRYLYIIIPNNVKYMLESCDFGRTLPRGNICHSNLTGGTEAWCGGELWFTTENDAYISGASGRYPPRSETEINEVAKLFVRHGFTTYSLGWNAEIDGPQRKYEKKLVKQIKDE